LAYTKRRKKPSDWYDEKQIYEISKASLITMAVSDDLVVLCFAGLSESKLTN